MVDIGYDVESLCGPADLRVARFVEEYRGHKFDPLYLRHVQQFHGGIPGKQFFDAEDGKTYRVGRFLTLLDEESKLPPPARPSWQFPERDVWIDWSVLTLIDQEGPSCRQLFDELLPFAALYRGKVHPDGMSLTSADCDLLCFRYEAKRFPPRIVVWLAHESAAEYVRWEAAGLDDVRYDDFTIPVARTFEAFLGMLRDKL